MKSMKVARGTARAKRRAAMDFEPRTIDTKQIGNARFYRLLAMDQLHKL